MTKAAEPLDQKFAYTPALYDSPERFYSCGFQAKEILQSGKPLRGARVLNIGTGGGMLRSYLRPFWEGPENFLEADIAPSLAPHVCCDAASLPFNGGFFDFIVCCQTLQYVSYDRFEAALDEFRRVLKGDGRLVLSLPDAGWYVVVNFYLPGLRSTRLLEIPFLSRPAPAASVEKHPGYWEVNSRGYPQSKVRRSLFQRFKILKEYRLPKHPHHHFYVLEKN